MDWKSIIAAIQAAGITQEEIGNEIGRSQAWVADVLRGRYSDLKWSDGEALRSLYAEKVSASETAKAA